MIDGNTNEDASMVLHFIYKSLKKGFPFVNTFLPLKTDVNNLVFHIIKHIKPLSNPSLANSCAMTQSSRLLLSAEIQIQLQELTQELKKTDMSMDKVFIILKSFRYFERYIIAESVQVAVREADNLLHNFITRQKNMIEDEILKGTFSEHHFGDANVAAIKVALLRLQTLESHNRDFVDCVDIESYESYIKRKLGEFEKQLRINHEQSLYKVCHQLSKMFTWSKGFPELRPFYERVKQHLKKLIEESIATCASENNHLFNLSLEQLERYIKNLAFLLSVSHNAENLHFHAFDTKRATFVYESAVRIIGTRVEQWRNETISELKGGLLIDAKLHSFAKNYSTIENLRNLLKQLVPCVDLTKQVEGFQNQLIGDIIETFENNAIILDIKDMEQSNDFQSKLMCLRLISEALNDIGNGVFQSVFLIYERIIHRIKSHVMKLQGETEQLTKMVKQEGIRKGAETVKILNNFQSMCWFDCFLPDGDKFIQNCFTTFQRTYIDRITLVETKFHCVLKQLQEKIIDSKCAVSELKAFLTESEQISLLAKVLEKDDLSTIQLDARKKLSTLLDSYIKINQNNITQWYSCMFDMNTPKHTFMKKTKKVENIFREVIAFRELGDQCDVNFDLFYKEILQILDSYSKKVEEIMKSSGKYGEKKHFLQITSILGSYSNISEHLQDETILREFARDAVASDAKDIEDFVSQSSEWDEIDSRIQEFEGAKILDSFISEEVSSRLRPLCKFREQKQEEVDNEIEKLIRDEDYRGIGEFLIP